MNQVDDATLVARMVEGDRQSLATLYDRHAPAMLAIGLRVLGQRREAEDLLHDVFLEAWRRADTYHPERATVRTWLTIRMRSRAVDRRRTAYARRVVATAPQAPTFVERPCAPQHEPGARADHARLRTALQALPEPQREVLLLAYFEGLSTSEIGTRLGISTGTVKSRTAAARAKLRRMLTQGAA